MIKVSLIVLCGLVAAAMLRRQSAAMRHWILAAAVACAAAAPALEWIVPAWDVERQGAPATAAARPATVTPTGSASPSGGPRGLSLADPSHPPPLGRALGWIWMGGTASAVLLLLAGMGRLWSLASRARLVEHGTWVDAAHEIAASYGVRRPVVLLQSGHPTLLVTWGLRRPRILLPAGAQDWPVERVRIVLAHELAHVWRGDWAAQIAADLVRAVYWFNPLVWMAAAQLRQESEHACDDAVLNLGVEGRTYAAHLLELARAAVAHHRGGGPAVPAPAIVRPSSLERRVIAMLNTRVNRNPPTRRARVAATVTVVTLAALIAGFGAAAQRFATFSGSVFDPHNGGVPKVTVVLTHAQSQAKYEVKSDESGRFEFAALPEGEYLLEAKYPGFMTLNGAVTVSGEDLHKNLALQIGSLHETITVLGTPGTAAEDVVRARPAVARKQQPCTPAVTGGNIRPPSKRVDVRPRYAQHLIDARVAGVVQLEARIAPDGNVADVQVVEAAHPDLGIAAMDAVRRWQFDSTLLNCVPVDVTMNVTVKFALEE